MALFLSAIKIREAEDFQFVYIVALLQVGLPGPGVPGCAALVVIQPEDGNHLVRIATGHGEVNAAPKLPHDGALDIADLSITS